MIALAVMVSSVVLILRDVDALDTLCRWVEDTACRDDDLMMMA